MSVRPVCGDCGAPATCLGEYEGRGHGDTYACDSCCGHGQEDGACRPIPRERPLLMSGPLVLATLEGRKTQTRRLPRPGGYGQPGDRLWVREAHMIGMQRTTDAPSRQCPTDSALWAYYAASKHPPAMARIPSIHMPRWASRLTLEILEVRTELLQAITEQDAEAEGLPPNWDDDFAKFRGSEHGWLTPAGVRHIEQHPESDCGEGGEVAGGQAYVFEARECFRLWWNHINGTRAPWTSNPEVTVITFKRVTS